MFISFSSRYIFQLITDYFVAKWCFPNVSATNNGNTRVASAHTFTGVASFLIFPHEIASSGLAPLSLPSKSHAVLTKTAKSAPFL